MAHTVWVPQYHVILVLEKSKTVERDTEECTCDVPSTDFSDFMMKGTV